MYYTDPYGLPEIRERIAALAAQFSGVPGVESPDKFAQDFYDYHYNLHKSPYTEGTNFTGIETGIAERYLNQPALVRARGGAPVSLRGDPQVEAAIAQGNAEAHARWQATQQKSSLFGDLFNIGRAAFSWLTQGPSPSAIAATVQAAASLGGPGVPNVPGRAGSPIVGRAAQLGGVRVDPLGAFFRQLCHD